MLDKAENPEKMVRLMIHEMEDTLTEVKSSAAEVIADRIRTQRQLESLNAHIEEWSQRAELAVSKNRDDLARVALERKLAYTRQVEAAQEALVRAEEMVKQYQEDISRLEEKLKSALVRQRELAMKHKRALNSRRLEENLSRANRHAFDRFDRYADRIDRINAEAEAHGMSSAPGQLEDEFQKLAEDGDIERELAKLKKKSQ
jgi:phage shock protein A